MNGQTATNRTTNVHPLAFLCDHRDVHSQRRKDATSFGFTVRLLHGARWTCPTSRPRVSSILVASSLVQERNSFALAAPGHRRSSWGAPRALDHAPPRWCRSQARWSTTAARCALCSDCDRGSPRADRPRVRSVMIKARKMPRHARPPNPVCGRLIGRCAGLPSPPLPQRFVAHIDRLSVAWIMALTPRLVAHRPSAMVLEAAASAPGVAAHRPPATAQKGCTTLRSATG